LRFCSSLGLAARAQHGFVETARVGRRTKLLRLEHEATALVEIDAARRGAAVTVAERGACFSCDALVAFCGWSITAEAGSRRTRETPPL